MRRSASLALLMFAFGAGVAAAAESPRATAPTSPATGPTVVRGTGRWLVLPVRNGAPLQHVDIVVGGRWVRSLDVELTDAKPDWQASVDLGERAADGTEVTLVGSVGAASALATVRRREQRPDEPEIYREPLRPQVHFSARRGHLNDPNGLVFYRGEYHLFFQHNPVGTRSANKHWGHAVSRDLAHWTEVAEALYPDETGMMYSGSAVVDWKNTSGFGRAGQPPLVLIYTASNAPRTQCLAFSTDGRTFTKYAGNPVLPNVTSLNRDPKVFWHEPTHRWVMVLYVGVLEKGAADSTAERHTVQFFTSPNLRDWSFASSFAGGAGRDDRFLYECPDFFPLPGPDTTGQMKWVLSGANGQYALGEFDGVSFRADASGLRAFQGRAYAGQTFNDEPQGRVVEMAWLRAASPGMPFSQCMSVPLALSLHRMPEGLRLAFWPVPEFDRLRGACFALTPGARPAGENLLADFNADVADIEVSFRPGKARRVVLGAQGTLLIYDANAGELRCGKVRAQVANGDRPVKLRVIMDRTSCEVFAVDGTVYLPLTRLPKRGAEPWSLTSEGGAFDLVSLAAYPLAPAMQETP